jgi:hypothetical protein
MTVTVRTQTAGLTAGTLHAWQTPAAGLEPGKLEYRQAFYTLSKLLKTHAGGKQNAQQNKQNCKLRDSNLQDGIERHTLSRLHYFRHT